MNTTDLLEKLIQGDNLSREEVVWLMNQIMDGQMTQSQMAALLVALRIKKETVIEISACASVMREKSTKIPIQSNRILDTCGTGGDRSGSFNISTTVALLLAGGGYQIAKHGNRSMTSKSGSADLLEALGININLSPDQVADSIRKTNIGFLFAPALHNAMKNVMPVRKELAVRTVFNLLGPLTNPAGAQYQIIGLFSVDLVLTIAQVLKDLGTKSAYVFAGLSGLDEVCIASDTKVAHLKPDGLIKEFIFNPEDYGFKKATLDAIKGGTAEQNAEITIGVLNGSIDDSRRDIVVINAGFAISAVKGCSLNEAFEESRKLIKSRVGIQKITELKTLSHSYN